jgi:peptide/nickel transport system permease protein
MVNEGRDFIKVAPWIAAFPALAIASLVISVNLLSDAIRQLAAGEI